MQHINSRTFSINTAGRAGQRNRYTASLLDNVWIYPSKGYYIYRGRWGWLFMKTRDWWWRESYIEFPCAIYLFIFVICAPFDIWYFLIVRANLLLFFAECIRPIVNKLKIHFVYVIEYNSNRTLRTVSYFMEQLRYLSHTSVFFRPLSWSINYNKRSELFTLMIEILYYRPSSTAQHIVIFRRYAISPTRCPSPLHTRSFLYYFDAPSAADGSAPLFVTRRFPARCPRHCSGARWRVPRSSIVFYLRQTDA